MTKYDYTSASSARSIARILVVLAVPRTYAEIAMRAHVAEGTARRYVAHLRQAGNKRVRVADFVLDGTQYTMLFVAGRARDAVKPVMGNAVRCRLLRERNRANADKRDLAVQHDRARRTIAKALAGKLADPLVMAICRPQRQVAA